MIGKNLYTAPSIRFWRDVLQGFVFTVCPDPMTKMDSAMSCVNAKFDNQTPLFFLLGNIIDLLHDHLYEISIHEWFPILRMLHILSSFLTLNWLQTVMNCYEVDKDYWCLKDQYSRLFDNKLIENLFEKVMQGPEDEERKCDERLPENSFFPDIGYHLIDIYSLWLCHASQGEGMI